MKSLIAIAAVLIVLPGVHVEAGTANQERLPDFGGPAFFTGSFQLGYYDGVGVHVSGTFANFAEGFPFQIRLGLGYAWVPTGDALLARRVFIDNATNGTPQSNGKFWDGRLDVLFPVKILSLQRTKVVGGIRRNHYSANFEYIGGNETFVVNCNQWGMGGGLETAFALSPRVDMLVSVGADYYFRGEMSGHDTYYRPNGDDLHAIGDYTYKDADAAIDQPDFNTRVMLGVGYRF
jgi:hypothetical protein